MQLFLVLLCSPFDVYLDFVQSFRGFLQLGDFLFGEVLLDDVVDSVFAEDARQGQEDVLVDFVKSLCWKRNIKNLNLNPSMQFVQ